MSRERSVALIVLDTVRKDAFDEYATRLRNRADVSFAGCRAASSWSVPSHASIFTGTLPSEHGAHAERFDAGFSFAEIDRERTFLADLDRRTVGLSANAYVNAGFGFDAWFDEFHDFSMGSHTNESLFPSGLTVQEYVKTAEGSTASRYLGFLGACAAHDHSIRSVANGVWSQIGHRLERLPIPQLVDDGAGVISRTALETTAAEEATSGDDEPYFLFANFMDAHTPHRTLRHYDDSLHSVPHSWSSKELDKWALNEDGAATESYTRNYREIYGAAIDYLDQRVDAMIEGLLARDPRTTVVVTADHGHNLGYEADGGLFHHTGSMSEGVMHVPCEVINPPAGYPEEVPGLFSQLRLGDLLVDLARGEPFDDDLTAPRIPAETIGLLGAGDGTWGREFDDATYARWNRMIRCVYAGGRKFEWDSLGDRYEYRLDPDRPCFQETVAIGVEVPEEARALFSIDLETYKRRAAGSEQDLDFDDGVENRLRELGYL